MTTFYQITLIQGDGSRKTYELHDQDKVETVDGGIEIVWHSSPRTTTFYPYHRIWEYEAIDTDKPKYGTQNVSNSTVGGSVTQVRNVKGNVSL